MDKNTKTIMRGTTTARLLNVRDKSDKYGNIVAQLRKGSEIDIVEKLSNGWYRFIYNNKNAYVFGKFVSFPTGRVTARLLNVRNNTSLNSQIVGQLRKDEAVEIMMSLPKWYKIKHEKEYAFVYAKFIDLSDKSEAKKKETSKKSSKKSSVTYLKDNKRLMQVKIKPDKEISYPSSPREQRTTGQTYNNFGGLLGTLSQEIKIDIATAIAVLAVESGGKGFGKTGKVIIRFENHLFSRFWGKDNKALFDKHFKHDSGKKWQGHLFRKNESDAWISFHGNQEKEWEVLTFARSLDNDKALLSASYGAPQVLGTNFKKLGYKNAEDLLNHFEKDIRYHIIALFDFFNSTMIKHLQNNEFTDFAKYYNGRGQAKRYGQYIENHYKAFKKLI